MNASKRLTVVVTLRCIQLFYGPVGLEIGHSS
jgi:hypothetical protein